MHNKKFFCLILVPAFIIVCVQLCLVNDDTREIFTNIETVEGVSYSREAQNEKVFVEFEIVRVNPNNNIILLYNAREIARFSNRKLEISVDCDGMFQIQNNTYEEVIINAKIKKAEDVVVKSYDIPVGITTLCFVDV